MVSWAAGYEPSPLGKDLLMSGIDANPITYGLYQYNNINLVFNTTKMA